MYSLSNSDCQDSDVDTLQFSRRKVLSMFVGTCSLMAFGCDQAGQEDQVGRVEDDQSIMPDYDVVSPSLLGLTKGVSCPLDLGFSPYEGRLPAALGYAFVMGPIPWGDGSPIFNGDGAILRLNLEEGQLKVKTRRLITPCALLDQASQGTEFAYQNRAFMRESSAFGVRNFLNTSPVPTFDGRLIATYDAGRPWEISPNTLELTTPIGGLDQWKPMLPPLTDAQRFHTQSMSTAHPAYDEHTREMYSVNYAPTVEGVNIEPFFDLLWWGDDGLIKKSPLINEDGSGCVLNMSCHQLQVTERFVILIDSALLIEPEQLFGLDVTRPQLPVTPIWVVVRDELEDGQPTTAHQYIVDSESAHFLAAYDDRDGIELLLVHQCSSDPSEWVRSDDQLAHGGGPVNAKYAGLPVAGADRLWLGKYLIDTERQEVSLEGSLHGEEMWGLTLWTQDPTQSKATLGEGWWITQGWHPELYTARIAETYRVQDHRTLDIGEMPERTQPCRLMKLDHESLTIVDQYQFDEGYIPLSPTFLPVENDEALSDSSGVILTFIQGVNGCEIWVFNADKVSLGPIAKCKHDSLSFGHTLHSTWLPSVDPPVAPYLISAIDELIERFDYLTPEAQSFAAFIFSES
jgi:all-trans-8'-apo-beta-carotenal 15,15'-oxygenase